MMQDVVDTRVSRGVGGRAEEGRGRGGTRPLTRPPLASTHGASDGQWMLCCSNVRERRRVSVARLSLSPAP